MADDSEEKYDDKKDSKGSSNNNGIALVFFLILFLPALLVGFLYSLLLTRGRFRTSMVALMVGLVDFLALIVWMLVDAGGKVSFVFHHLSALPTVWHRALPAGVIASVVLGGFVGLGLCVWNMRQYKSSPHQHEIAGSWMYNFRFRRTPWELRKRDKLIEGLKAGTFESLEKSPLGLDENEEFKVAYQHHDEAVKHTIITGASGSGKTITLYSKIKTDIDMGRSIAVLDMKASPEFAAKLATWAKENGSEFYHFMKGTRASYDVDNSPGQAFYNPLSSGDVDAKVGMLLGMREWNTDSEVYKSYMQEVLTVIFRMLEDCDRNYSGLQREAYEQLAGFSEQGKAVALPQDKRRIMAKGDPEFSNFINLGTNLRLAKWAQKHLVVGKSKNEKSSYYYLSPEDASRGASAERYSMQDLDKALVRKGILRPLMAPIFDWDAGDLAVLNAAIETKNLQHLVAACIGTPVEKAAYDFLESSRVRNSPQERAMVELRANLRTLMSSGYGQWLKTVDHGRSINMFELTQNDKVVVLFSLNADSDADFAKRMGALIMADITNTSAKRRNKSTGNSLNIYVDEYQTLNPDSVKDLLEKSRSSKIAVTLTQQSFEQVAASTTGGASYVTAMIETVSNFLVHAGSTEGTAKKLSEIIGSDEYDAYSVTNKHTGGIFGLNRRNKQNQVVQTKKESRLKFSPNNFMKLSMPDASNGFKATAVFITKESNDEAFRGTEGGVARIVRMIPQDAVLKEYYTGSKLKEEKEVLARKKVGTLAPEDFASEVLSKDVPEVASRGSLPSVPGVASWDEDEEADGGFTIEAVEEAWEDEASYDDLAKMPLMLPEEAEVPESKASSGQESGGASVVPRPRIVEEEAKPQVKPLPKRRSSTYERLTEAAKKPTGASMKPAKGESSEAKLLLPEPTAFEAQWGKTGEASSGGSPEASPGEFILPEL